MVYKQAHSDPDGGQQYHVQFTPENDPQRRYWTWVTDSLEHAKKVRDTHADYDPVIFVRDVSPWRELDDENPVSA